MKVEKKFFSKMESELNERLEDSPGLSEKSKNELMAKIEQLEKAEEPAIDQQKVLNFKEYVQKASKMAEDIYLDMEAESNAKAGWINLSGKCFCFPTAIDADAKSLFAELINNATDFSIYHRDGLVVAHLLYVFM